MPSLSGSAPRPPRAPVRVFFPCTGLGRQQRGFETFTLECAEALRGDPRVEITVFGGGATTGPDVRVVANTPRHSRAAALIGAITGRGPYFAEQLTFFLSFLPHLVRGRPDVVYFADLNLGNLCWHWRRLTGQRYALLFYNGGLTTKPFTRADLVQQLTPEGLREASARGESAARQVVLAHGVRMTPVLSPRLPAEARIALGLPADRKVILGVGLLDVSIKRMDYLIREVAALPTPRPFLALLGAEGEETPALRRLAIDLLGDAGVMLRTVPADRMADYYRAADVFALASLREGFGLAYVEALSHGLPIVAHDTPVTRFLLGDDATLVDLTRSGAATAAIQRCLAAPPTSDEREARHASAHARFGWDALRDAYVAMFERAADA